MSPNDRSSTSIVFLKIMNPEHIDQKSLYRLKNDFKIRSSLQMISSSKELSEMSKSSVRLTLHSSLA